MEILINGQMAVLKSGTSFEFIAENRLFSGSDSYSLSITFPLKDCAENIRIFGHIHRADVLARKAVFDCEIRHGSFFQFGTIVVNEISEVEVKCQFLEGRSETNFDTTFDDLYINELDLGSWPSQMPTRPSDAWNPTGQDLTAVALPWVNDYSGIIQNCVTYANGAYSWHSETRALSWQPYLIYVVEKICEAIGYACDLSAWRASEEHKFLLVCNTLPSAWYVKSYAAALPHWTVAEFFEKLELFLGCEFDVNHRSRTIGFAFTKETLGQINAVELANIVDEHTTEVSVEDAKCEYLEAKNLVYKECDHRQWPFYSCDWYIRGGANSAERYATMTDLLNATSYCAQLRNYGRGSLVNKLLYAEDLDMYFCLRAYKKVLFRKSPDSWMPNRYTYYMRLVPVNEFGGRIVNPAEDAEEVELDFVPAWIDDTDDTYGRCLFLSFSNYDEDDTTGSGVNVFGDPEERAKEANDTLYQPMPVQIIHGGEQEKRGEYYDRIYVAHWDGAGENDGLLPRPRVSSVEIRPDWSYRLNHFSLRLNDRNINSRRQVYKINPRIKSTFKFLSDTIPNPRSKFIIHGKPCVCEKITATFTERGMSALLKGVFYPIEE